MNQIVYKRGYKYQLREDYEVDTGIEGYKANTPYIKLYKNGNIKIKKGYAWDGPSGPTIDTKTFMRGAFVHDALYQLLREGHLPAYEGRLAADQLMRRFCREDGMSWLRAWYTYTAVRVFGKKSAEAKGGYPTETAP
jgi:hypothetical protein